MDEETRKRLEELHRQIELVLREEPTMIQHHLLSREQEMMHQAGYEKWVMRLPGCQWELVRTPA